MSLAPRGTFRSAHLAPLLFRAEALGLRLGSLIIALTAHPRGKAMGALPPRHYARAEKVQLVAVPVFTLITVAAVLASVSVKMHPTA